MCGDRLFAVAILVLAAVSASAELLRDLRLRVDYGYYRGDGAVLRATLPELEQQRDTGRDAAYLYALALYRLAGLTDRSGQIAGLLDSCVTTAETLAGADGDTVEALVLVAACSQQLARVEPLKAVLHERRSQRALNTAAGHDPGNPRVALLRALASGRDGGRDDDYVARLEAAAARFGDRVNPTGVVWGEAETLVLLAAARLEAGDLRAARDALENALLLVPGFVDALRLQSQLTISDDALPPVR